MDLNGESILWGKKRSCVWVGFVVYGKSRMKQRPWKFGMTKDRWIYMKREKKKNLNAFNTIACLRRDGVGGGRKRLDGGRRKYISLNTSNTVVNENRLPSVKTRKGKKKK